MQIASIQEEVMLSFANSHFNRRPVVELGAAFAFFSNCEDEFCEYGHVRVSFFCVERISVSLHKPLSALVSVN